jgi:hypothetical protein
LYKTITLVSLTIFLALLVQDQARADSIYSYTGPDFNVIANTINPALVPPFSDLDNVSGTVTLTTPIVSDGFLTDFRPDVVSYTISDGVQTLSNSDSTLQDLLFETTNGQITVWHFVVDDTNMPNIVIQIFTGSQGGNNIDLGEIGYLNGPGNQAYVQPVTPGLWSVAPEPSSFSLFLSTMAAVGLSVFGKRVLRRKTAPCLPTLHVW